MTQHYVLVLRVLLCRPVYSIPGPLHITYTEKKFINPVLKNCGFKGFLRPDKVPGLIFKTLVTFLNAENARRVNNSLWLRLPCGTYQESVVLDYA